MKYIIQLFVFLLPFHAIFVTYMKCKIGYDTNILRFWKEIVLITLLFIVGTKLLLKNKFNIKEIYKNNYLLGLTTAFTISSFIYIYFPYFDPRINAYLGFKYDVIFLFALIVGLYLSSIKNHFDKILMSVFTSVGVILIIFLPWYLSGDISSTSTLIGFSDKPSTYEANSCISFSQNVTGGHNRFQGSFGDPIRWSVFMVIFYFMYIGFILHENLYKKSLRNALLIIPSIFVFVAIFFSYTKTSILGILFGGILFWYLVGKFKHGKKISKKFIINSSIIIGIFLVFILYIKRALFLHPEALLGRIENLIESYHMFMFNPFGYGLGIAGPATQLATSSDLSLASGVHKFLPENWYIQILLEQSLIGLGLFVALLSVIGVYLYRIVKLKKDYLSIGIFTSYITILFMANFTHIFEESATSFILFLIVGAYIAKESRDFRYLK
ncbi:MAG: O-antigen ligase family protein [Candidatus Gracilibacteria bacterium]|nr:O-antigen ligase family protein [Candidatus Gracilibacteria bacterium]